jgi:hypothetical protein
VIAVGTELHYQHLIHAIKYYEKAGFKWLDVPWTVSKEVLYLTRPVWIQGEPPTYIAGGQEMCPVASAEQSYLQMQMDAIAAGQPMTGSYVTMSPCFRNEAVLDELHLPYFMKVELISWDKTTHEDLSKMVAHARLLFEENLWVDCIKNTDPDPIGVAAFDLITANTGIELGSYGIREHPKVGRWLYGTGLAEPRYSTALEKEEPYNQRVEAFF